MALSVTRPYLSLLTQDVLAQTFELFIALLIALHALAIFLQIQLERFDIVVETQCGHGEQDVFSVDSFPLLGLHHNNFN